MTKFNTSALFACLAVMCVATMLTTETTHAQIEINSVEALQRIGTDPAYPLNGHYVLTRDIDAAGTRYWNDGAGFSPIGQRLEDDDSAAFNGWFDGQGYVIRNLHIYRPDEHGVGLFGSIGGAASVLNVGLEGGTIIGGHYVGGLVGENWSETVALCHADIDVEGLSRVGGLAGINRGILDSCYAAGSVEGTFFVGGLSGRNYTGLIIECLAVGPVSGNTGLGGLVGNAFEAETIASFWDITTSGRPVSDGGWGAETAVLLDRRTYLNAEWNFQEVWTMLPGRTYPYFR